MNKSFLLFQFEILFYYFYNIKYFIRQNKLYISVKQSRP